MVVRKGRWFSWDVKYLNKSGAVKLSLAYVLKITKAGLAYIHPLIFLHQGSLNIFFSVSYKIKS